jgi:thiamine-phosphate pyrophosphorylase
MLSPLTVKQDNRILSVLPLSGLYAIVACADVEPILRGGCRIIQYRNKQASRADNKMQATVLRDLCHRYQALLIINDDVELALAIGADGVHLGQADTSLNEARQRLGASKIIGVSCHNSLELARQAEQQGADYVAFGRFFESRTKPDAPQAELDILRAAKQQLRIPVVAIGGITRDNAARVIAQGADMIAVIDDLFAAQDAKELEARAKTFTQLFPFK